MLLAASQLRDGALTVGDFVLFVSYLAIVTDFTAELGQYLAQFRQTTVAFGRLRPLLGDAPASALAAPAPLHLRGRCRMAWRMALMPTALTHRHRYPAHAMERGRRCRAAAARHGDRPDLSPPGERARDRRRRS